MWEILATVKLEERQVPSDLSLTHCVTKDPCVNAVVSWADLMDRNS